MLIRICVLSRNDAILSYANIGSGKIDQAAINVARTGGVRNGCTGAEHRNLGLHLGHWSMALLASAERIERGGEHQSS